MENVDHLVSTLIQRLADYAVRIEDLEASVEAHQLALGWLLHRQPDSLGIQFLSSQANEFDLSEKRQTFLGVIAQLDELRELVLHLHDDGGRQE